MLKHRTQKNCGCPKVAKWFFFFFLHAIFCQRLSCICLHPQLFSIYRMMIASSNLTRNKRERQGTEGLHGSGDAEQGLLALDVAVTGGCWEVWLLFLWVPLLDIRNSPGSLSMFLLTLPTTSFSFFSQMRKLG